MKNTEDIEELVEKSYLNKLRVPADAGMDSRVLDDAVTRMEESRKRNLALAEPNVRRIIMNSRVTKIGAAAAIIVAITLLFSVLDRSAAPTYALEQAVKAMDAVETVYFSAYLYKQGPVECWMKFSGKSKKPSHIALFLGPFSIRKIDNSKGSFAYNPITNRVRRIIRDERKASWYLDFAGFLKQALKSANRSKSVRIVNEMEQNLQREVIAIYVDEGGRECKYLIDPETKLPISFTTVKTRDIRKYWRKTIAVKYMDRIEYNKPVPDGTFDFPEDAEFVTNEHDIIVHPGIGMPTEGLTREQACMKIIRDVTKAMNDLDWETVAKLQFPFGVPPEELLAELKIDQYEPPLVELQELGEPYQKGDYWFVHCVYKEPNGQIKEEEVPVKFYEFDGKSYCLIAYED
ncbi:MAG: hypothetical protein ACYTBS_03555 [Planctomycetota bacterium]|jgi:hypothetical protein